MATWGDFAAAEPELADAVKRRFDAGVHKTIATLRRDGSPRISGIEADVVLGELWFGSMWGARKARDLQRDPRFALHSASADPPGWDGDAKLSGRAEEITDLDRFRAYQAARASGEEAEPEPAARFHLFRAELTEVVVIGLNDARDRLVIDHWAEGGGVRRLERE